MSFSPRYAVLLDGAFVIHKLSYRLRTFPAAEDIEALADALATHPCVANHTRLRIYFYHAYPAVGRLRNPISGDEVDLARTTTFRQHERLLDRLELRKDFALRLGELSTHEWKLGQRALESMMETPRSIEANDLVPKIEQKGVDLRIGLDIARLALTRTVQSIIAVSGDSDLIPAFRFARREGLRVFLYHFDHPVRRGLKAHSDEVIQVALPYARSGVEPKLQARRT